MLQCRFFVASSLEDESVFGLGFRHVQKGICSSSRLHIHKPKDLLVAASFVASSCEGESVFTLLCLASAKGSLSKLVFAHP